jgi:YidC/Oxa1 family membrane protein insertase
MQDNQAKIGFALIVGVVLVWLYVSAPDAPEQSDATDRDTAAQTQTDSLADSANRAADDAPTGDEETDRAETIQPIDADADDSTDAAPKKKELIAVVETNLTRVMSSSKGGKPIKLFLKNYYHWRFPNHKNDYPDEETRWLQLLDSERGGSFDIEFVTADGKLVNTEELDFEPLFDAHRFVFRGDDSLIVYRGEDSTVERGVDEATLAYRAELPEGGAIVREYVYHRDRYIVDFIFRLENMQGKVADNYYDIVWDSGIRFVEKNTSDEANYANASVHYGGERVELDATDEEVEKDNFTGRVEWGAVRNKYFAAVLGPRDPAGVEEAYLEGYGKTFPDGGKKEFYTFRLKMKSQSVPQFADSFFVYMGPVEYDRFEELGRDLTSIVDFGSFLGLTFIIRPIAEYLMLPLFNFLHVFIPNYGVVLLVFAFIIKVVLYPLTQKSYDSMKKMQKLQPKMKELKEQYKDDQQRMQKETMALYSKYGVNPAGGCLPMLLQMPIFVALWGLFQTAIDLRQEPFVWWITDLSRPDIVLNLGFPIPLLGIEHVSGLALLMGLTTFLQQKTMTVDPQQKAMIYIMPIFLTLLFMSFPAGLNLYYFAFNVLTMAQQKLVNYFGKDVELQPVDPKKKKKGFMERMMETAEQRAKEQQRASKKKR